MPERKSFAALYADAVASNAAIVIVNGTIAFGAWLVGVYAWASGQSSNVVFAVMTTAFFVSIPLLMFFNYTVWRGEREEVIALERQIRKDEPLFVGFIDWMLMKERADDCQVLIAVNVTNSGAPSILERWRIRLHPEDAESYEIAKDRPLPDDVLTFEWDLVTEIKGSEFINFKTHPKGIARGDGCRGLLLSSVPKNLKPNWRVVVSFQDVTGKTWETKPYQPSIRPQASGFAELGGWSGLDIRHRPLSSG
jgi:hypothetical protein